MELAFFQILKDTMYPNPENDYKLHVKSEIYDIVIQYIGHYPEDKKYNELSRSAIKMTTMPARAYHFVPIFSRKGITAKWFLTDICEISELSGLAAELQEEHDHLEELQKIMDHYFPGCCDHPTKEVRDS